MSAGGTWRDEARRHIAKAIESAGPGATLDQKRKAISKAYPFGERRYWPYKVWCSEVREMLGISATQRRAKQDRNASLFSMDGTERTI